jgi:hypothetical protein
MRSLQARANQTGSASASTIASAREQRADYALARPRKTAKKHDVDGWGSDQSSHFWTARNRLSSHCFPGSGCKVTSPAVPRARNPKCWATRTAITQSTIATSFNRKWPILQAIEMEGFYLVLCPWNSLVLCPWNSQQSAGNGNPLIGSGP